MNSPRTAAMRVPTGAPDSTAPGPGRSSPKGTPARRSPATPASPSAGPADADYFSSRPPLVRAASALAPRLSPGTPGLGRAAAVAPAGKRNHPAVSDEIMQALTMPLDGASEQDVLTLIEQIRTALAQAGERGDLWGAVKRNWGYHNLQVAAKKLAGRNCAKFSKAQAKSIIDGTCRPTPLAPLPVQGTVTDFKGLAAPAMVFEAIAIFFAEICRLSQEFEAKGQCALGTEVLLICQMRRTRYVLDAAKDALDRHQGILPPLGQSIEQHNGVAQVRATMIDAYRDLAEKVESFALPA